jgi:hypothetical protein
MELNSSKTLLASGTEKESQAVGSKKGWSLAKKVKWITILVLFLAVAIFLATTIGINKARSFRANSEARQYVEELYPGYKIEGSVCQGEDTDLDAYVSCDLNISKDSISRVINIQCPTILKSFLGNSCKQTRPVLAQ